MNRRGGALRNTRRCYTGAPAGLWSFGERTAHADAFSAGSATRALHGEENRRHFKAILEAKAMTVPTRSTLCLVAMTLVGSHVSEAQGFRPEDVIALERAALERWGRGDPQGFLETYAPEITYFDPFSEKRIDGLDAMKALLAPIAGKVKVDRFEIVNPKVQHHGDVAVLSYNVVNFMKKPDGSESPATRWNSTAVFQRIDGRWRTIHSHWSFTRPELKLAPQ
jgi:uncharacterized protein (TIGR02246 family)